MGQFSRLFKKGGLTTPIPNFSSSFEPVQKRPCQRTTWAGVIWMVAYEDPKLIKG